MVILHAHAIMGIKEEKGEGGQKGFGLNFENSLLEFPQTNFPPRPKETQRKKRRGPCMAHA